LLELAECYQQIGEIAQARSALNRALRIKGASAEAARRLRSIDAKGAPGSAAQEPAKLPAAAPASK
jgi:hypothetical protein